MSVYPASNQAKNIVMETPSEVVSREKNPRCIFQANEHKQVTVRCTGP